MPKSLFSIRGLLIGIALSLAVGLLAPYGVVFNYYWVGFNPSSPGALFLFFVLTFAVNGFVALLGRHFALSKADLVLIYCMLMMAVTVPTWGLMFFLIGTIVYPFYYATPENNYAELFYDFIPSWIAPQDFEAIKNYYEGLPKGESIPWGVWVEPMAYWLALIVAMSFMLICMSAILHRQWSEHERLTYPMVQLPQNMIEKEANVRVASFFKDQRMWVGFALPCILLSLNALNHYFPIVPEYNPRGRFSFLNHTLHLPVALNLAWVGFFYLVNLEITFSIWFFYVFSKVEEGVFKTLGIASTERLSAYEYSQPADLTHQATGRGHCVGAVLDCGRPAPISKRSGASSGTRAVASMTARSCLATGRPCSAFWAACSSSPCGSGARGCRLRCFRSCSSSACCSSSWSRAWWLPAAWPPPAAPLCRRTSSFRV